MPKIDKSGIQKEITKNDIENAIKANKNIKLIVLTSPTYEGIISNIKEIVEVAHSYNIPVLVDEAHGSHLKFIEGMEKYEALNSGADIVIQSLHKTLPALTQTAILHIQGDLVEEKEVARELSIFETSSPSYIFIASIEECLDFIEKRRSLFKKYQENINEFYEETKKLKNLKILGNILDKQTIYDFGKIVILTDGTNLTGKELANILRRNYEIEVEMSYTNYVISMTSVCDPKENFKRLQKALFAIDKKIENVKEKTQEYKMPKISLPERKYSINEALLCKEEEKININDAEGQISKEYIWVYPPGIPIIVPGEIINKNTIQELKDIMKTGIEIRTTNDEFPNVYIKKENI